MNGLIKDSPINSKKDLTEERNQATNMLKTIMTTSFLLGYPDCSSIENHFKAYADASKDTFKCVIP